MQARLIFIDGTIGGPKVLLGFSNCDVHNGLLWMCHCRLACRASAGHPSFVVYQLATHYQTSMFRRDDYRHAPDFQFSTSNLHTLYSYSDSLFEQKLWTLLVLRSVCLECLRLVCLTRHKYPYDNVPHIRTS